MQNHTTVLKTQYLKVRPNLNTWQWMQMIVGDGVEMTLCTCIGKRKKVRQELLCKFVGFLVLTSMVMKSSVSWEIMSYILLKVNKLYGGKCYSACYLPSAGFLVGLFFNLEDRGNVFLTCKFGSYFCPCDNCRIFTIDNAHPKTFITPLDV
jgi:hypothetical protein